MVKLNREENNLIVDEESSSNQGCCKRNKRKPNLLNQGKIDRAKDELDYATNWVRVFTTSYQQLKWLYSYAEINEIAIEKVTQKFCKEFFTEDAKVLKSDLLKFISKRQFCHRKILEDIIDSFYIFFVATLADGDETRARNMLEAKNMQIRRKDAM